MNGRHNEIVTSYGGFLFSVSYAVEYISAVHQEKAVHILQGPFSDFLTFQINSALHIMFYVRSYKII